jgi:hypothetical protein
VSIPFSADDWIKRRRPIEAPVTVKRIEDYSDEDRARWAKCTGHIKDAEIRTLATQTKKSTTSGILRGDNSKKDIPW